MRARSRGFTLVTALFVIVVLGLLGAYMVTVNVAQQSMGSMGIQQARAFAAAQSGLEWATWRALSGTCAAASFTLADSTLAGFDVSVACTSTLHRIGTTDVRYAEISVTASRGVFGEDTYASRTLTATVGNVP